MIIHERVDNMDNMNNMSNMSNQKMYDQKMYDDCMAMMNYHALLRMQDGREIDGIIESVDPDNVNVLMGEDVIMRDDDDNRQTFNNPRRYRRFRRERFPLSSLLALSLLPYPYYAPPYPYAAPYPYYPY